MNYETNDKINSFKSSSNLHYIGTMKQSRFPPCILIRFFQIDRMIEEEVLHVLLLHPFNAYKFCSNLIKKKSWLKYCCFFRCLKESYND